MPSSNNDRSGYTLIEIMVSVAIIGILTAIIFVGFANSQERTAVRHAAENAEINIRETQNRAQSGELLGGTDAVPRYGIYFDTDPTLSGQYIVFADNGTDDAKNNMKFDVEGGVPVDTVVKTVTLPKNVVIFSFTVDGSTDYAADRLHITYQVPSAAVNQLAQSDSETAGEMTTDSASIVFRHSESDICYSININTISGAVSRRQLENCP